MTATPVHLATVRAEARRAARAIVYAGLDWCPTCERVGDCRTATGRKTRAHVARRAA